MTNEKLVEPAGWVQIQAGNELRDLVCRTRARPRELGDFLLTNYEAQQQIWRWFLKWRLADASPPAPSGWQQRIAAAIAAVTREAAGAQRIKVEADTLYGIKAHERWYPKATLVDTDALMELCEAWQHAKDALPPSYSADLPFLKSLESGLTALRAFMGEGRHAHTCNGDEDGPCDCGYVDPKDVVETMLLDVRSRKAALPPVSEASPVKEAHHDA